MTKESNAGLASDNQRNVETEIRLRLVQIAIILIVISILVAILLKFAPLLLPI